VSGPKTESVSAVFHWGWLELDGYHYDRHKVETIVPLSFSP